MPCNSGKHMHADALICETCDHGAPATVAACTIDPASSVYLQKQLRDGVAEGDVDLGGHMHFRSTLGIGTNITDSAALSFAFSHISNGGLNDRKPGMDMVMLRLIRRY
jgi:hypothetical protein